MNRFRAPAHRWAAGTAAAAVLALTACGGGDGGDGGAAEGAATLAELLHTPATAGATLELVGGDTPVADAIAAVVS